jgi:hypothetical protein
MDLFELISAVLSLWFTKELPVEIKDKLKIWVDEPYLL